MKNLHRLLWVVALFPWFDLVIRQGLPSIVASTWDEVLLLASLVLLAVYFRGDRRHTLIPKSVVWPFGLFAFFAAASIVVNVVPLAVSIDAVRVVFQPMLFLFLTMYLMDNEDTRKTFLQIIIVSTVLIAAFGIVQYALKWDLGLWQHVKDTGQFRITSIFSNPNALGAYFNMVLAFTVPGVLFAKNIKHKVGYLAVSGIIFVALLLTFSRSAWIAFVAMVMYVVFVWSKKWLLAIPVLAVATPFVMPESVISRFAHLLDPAYYQMSAEYGRLAFWGEALAKIREHPFLGVGLGTFGDSVPLRHNIPFSTWVDNHYLKLGAEIGLPGLLAFLGLLLALFLLSHRLFRKAATENQKLYSLGIAGVIITMTVENVTASIWESLVCAIFFYSFVGVLFAMVDEYYREGLMVGVLGNGGLEGNQPEIGAEPGSGPLKILHVIGGGEKGGSRSHLVDLCKGLEEEGHQTEIVCFLEDAVAASCREQGISVTVLPMKNIFDFSAVARLSEHIAGGDTESDSIGGARGGAVDFSGAAAGAVGATPKPPDLVHTHGVRGNMIGRLSAFRAGIPVVTTVHSSIYQDYSHPLKKLLYHRIEKMTRKYTDRFIAVAGSLKEELERDGIAGDKIDVVYNGIKLDFVPGEAATPSETGDSPKNTREPPLCDKNTAESSPCVTSCVTPYVPSCDTQVSFRQELNIPRDTPLIMTIGRLEAVKNQEMFLKVCGELRDRGVSFHAEIVGDGPLRQDLEAQSQALNLQEHVSFLGFRRDIYRLLSATDLFMLTSRMEGMPITLLEAMATGTPVLVTAVGGMPEVIQIAENGWVVEVDNVQECAEKAATLLKDASLRKEMASRGKDALEKWFSYSTFIANTLAVYQKVLQER